MGLIGIVVVGPSTQVMSEVKSVLMVTRKTRLEVKGLRKACYGGFSWPNLANIKSHIWSKDKYVQSFEGNDLHIDK